MRTQTLLKVAVLTGLLALSGCASKVAEPDKYSEFLKNYSDLKGTKSTLGQMVFRWTDPSYNESKYDNIAYNPVTYYPVPKPTAQVGQQALDQLLIYTNMKLKAVIGQRKPLVTTLGPRSLIFRGAITGVTASKEGLQFYEVVSVTLLVTGAQMATGYRTMDANLYFEGKLIDTAINRSAIKVVRRDEDKDLDNESTPMTFETLKKITDNVATDASMSDMNQKPQ